LFRTGNATPRLTVSPTALDFGNVAIGTTTQRTIVVQNTGGTVLNGSAVFTGSGAFTLRPDTSFNLNPGISSAMVVGFTAEGFGGFDGALLFMSNGGSVSVPVGANVGIMLSGRVTDARGAGVLSVPIELHGSLSGSTVTDGTGTYRFFVQPDSS